MPVFVDPVRVQGDEGGLVQLFHPNGGNPHIELTANEPATGCGVVNITDGQGNTTIQLNGGFGDIILIGRRLCGGV